jgi:hypothetical protein
MISQVEQCGGGVAELRSESGLANHGLDPTLQPVLLLDRTAMNQTPKSVRIAAERELEAHVERRQRLAAQIRVENPARTEEEIEARLEQFGV